jgi:hypothetical protein
MMIAATDSGKADWKKLCPLKKILLPFDFLVAGATGFSAAPGNAIIKVARNNVMSFVILICFWRKVKATPIA